MYDFYVSMVLTFKAMAATPTGQRYALFTHGTRREEPLEMYRLSPAESAAYAAHEAAVQQRERALQDFRAEGILALQEARRNLKETTHEDPDTPLA